MPETESRTRSQVIEEIIWSGFPEGHVALRNPRVLAVIINDFIEGQEADCAGLALDSIALNHVAFRMARPKERFQDSTVQAYRDLAEYVLRALALAGA